MALDREDKTKLTMMRYGLGASKVADLIESMDRSYGELPAMKQVNATFSDLASKNTAQLSKLNEALEKNPGLADKIKANLGRNPEAFRTQFLPAVFKNPENAVALADQAPVAKTAAPAPFQKSYGDYPEPGPVRAAEAHKNPAAVALDSMQKVGAGVLQGQSPSAAATVAGVAADQRLAQKMDQLGKADGFDDLMDRVAKNDHLGAAMKAVMGSNGSAADREQSVDMLLKKTQENPKFFKNIVQQIDDFPGAVSGIASQIAGDPKNALAKLSELGDEGGAMASMGPLAKILGKMFGGGGMNMGGAGGPMGFINMIMSVIMAVAGGGGFGGSMNHLVIGNNNKMEQYDRAVRATNASPQQVASIDSSGNVVSGAQAQTQATDQNKAKPVVQQSLPA